MGRKRSRQRSPQRPRPRPRPPSPNPTYSGHPAALLDMADLVKKLFDEAVSRYSNSNNYITGDAQCSNYRFGQEQNIQAQASSFPVSHGSGVGGAIKVQVPNGMCCLLIGPPDSIHVQFAKDGATGLEESVITVPSNKVDSVIGKQGEIIADIQARSGARVQVLPSHLPPDDKSTERELQINGLSEQIQVAKQMINEVIKDPEAYPGAPSVCNMSQLYATGHLPSKPPTAPNISTSYRSSMTLPGIPKSDDQTHENVYQKGKFIYKDDDGLYEYDDSINKSCIDDCCDLVIDPRRNQRSVNKLKPLECPGNDENDAGDAGDDGDNGDSDVLYDPIDDDDDDDSYLMDAFGHGRDQKEKKEEYFVCLNPGYFAQSDAIDFLKKIGCDGSEIIGYKRLNEQAFYAMLSKSEASNLDGLDGVDHTCAVRNFFVSASSVH